MEKATNTQLSVVDELKMQINEIKDRIKQGEFTDDVFSTLTVGAKVLQGKLDNLLRKGGIYTQSDVNDAYATMQEIKRKNLEIESLKSKYRLYIYLGVALALGVGIYIYVKNK